MMLTLSCLVLAFLPTASSPEAEGVSSAGLVKWLDACDRELGTLHGFVLLRHGKLIAEGSWAPYDTLNEPHRLYSHSKAFTSTAVGFLADAGKLDLDERVIDILLDKAPAEPCENLRALRVRDLLTMNVGATKSDAERNDPDGDWEKAFLANGFESKPGQVFRYDSGATYLLSAIVERRSGRPLMEFLQERLFGPLGIVTARSTVSPSGTACGGWGMSMTTREIALFGQLYLDKGLWKGRRLLSEEWIALASARQTWSGPIAVTGQDGSDWHCGYGFKFWRCRHNCYRADGANGQFTIVMPEQDAVLSLHAGAGDTQKELNLVWEHVLPALAKRALPAAPKDAARLRQRCAALAFSPVAGSRADASPFAGIEFKVDNGPMHVRGIRLGPAAGGGLKLHVTTAAGAFALPVGFGSWSRGALTFSDRRHEVLGDTVGEQRVATSAAVLSNGRLKVEMLFLDGPHRMILGFFMKDGEPGLEGSVYCHGGGVFKGVRR